MHTHTGQANPWPRGGGPRSGRSRSKALAASGCLLPCLGALGGKEPLRIWNAEAAPPGSLLLTVPVLEADYGVSEQLSVGSTGVGLLWAARYGLGMDGYVRAVSGGPVWAAAFTLHGGGFSCQSRDLWGRLSAGIFTVQARLPAGVATASLLWADLTFTPASKSGSPASLTERSLILGAVGYTAPLWGLRAGALVGGILFQREVVDSGDLSSLQTQLAGQGGFPGGFARLEVEIPLGRGLVLRPQLLALSGFTFFRGVPPFPARGIQAVFPFVQLAMEVS